MDNKVYVLTFIDKNKNPHTMTSYGWREALKDGPGHCERKRLGFGEPDESSGDLRCRRQNTQRGFLPALESG